MIITESVYGADLCRKLNWLRGDTLILEVTEDNKIILFKQENDSEINLEEKKIETEDKTNKIEYTSKKYDFLSKSLCSRCKQPIRKI